MRAVILAMGLLASPAVAADQFDLVCRSPDRGPLRYRVDLTRNEACSGECDRVWKMGQSTSGELRVVDQSPARGDDIEERSVINRHSGRWTYNASVNGRLISHSGTCDVADFSGFPSARF